ncbi:hypothetical protein FF125_01640 [Aureibaculum algae]|uniref:Uncharacterized protein n=1 Tax=Aureibaculum algae TaxID=2584122 RepID=A0A5B7TPN7_9FLAO|nr:DUF6625 family protein [Aureibaculum algae]QCX37204.1 hypothetical protein FF125_01640 [Aureibaculum algae]
MKNILLINCYFGKFPWYFNLFLKSCSYNASVDFIIFSDDITEYNLPKNVEIVPFTLRNFNALATEKLKFEVNVEKAYKLCDFKPAYGIIFSEFVNEYEFWGMTDIDIIFGRIREFITEELLNNYEVISVRNDYPTGSFMLFKNNNEINNLFKKSKDYKKVLTSDIHYCFDECNFKHEFLQYGGDIFDIECEVESMHYVIKKEEQMNNLKAHFDFLVIEGMPGQLKWDKGFLSFKHEFEILLHHLILFKGNKYTRKKAWKRVPDKFYIDKFLVRKANLSSFNGLFKNTIYNKIVPNLKKSLFKIDFFLSRQFKLKIMDLRKQALIQSKVKVVYNSEFETHNSIGQNKQPKIFKSILFKDSFFTPFIPNLRYKLKDNNQFDAIHINGNVRLIK